MHIYSSMKSFTHGQDYNFPEQNSTTLMTEWFSPLLTTWRITPTPKVVHWVWTIPHRLRYFNTWCPAGSTVWKDPGQVLKAAATHWRSWVTRGWAQGLITPALLPVVSSCMWLECEQLPSLYTWSYWHMIPWWNQEPTNINLFFLSAFLGVFYDINRKRNGMPILKDGGSGTSHQSPPCIFCHICPPIQIKLSIFD